MRKFQCSIRINARDAKLRALRTRIDAIENRFLFMILALHYAFRQGLLIQRKAA